MANATHAFKDRDVKRVIKASRAAGLDPASVEVDPTTGKITVYAGKSGGMPGSQPTTPFEAWKAKKNARAAQGDQQ
jgi:hypothetical protein